MSQSSGKAKAKKINILDDKFGKKARALESKKKDMDKNESKVVIHAGTSAGAFVTGKKFVIKMKSLKNRHVQTHDSDSDVGGDCVTFIKQVVSMKVKSED